ncbi:MAG: hypothetical protein L3J88_03575 [Gammaproteobacteria bacterium]|nr:hypothetical protein [Gammaproteobacteria bacterium]MCF6362429.1 hypothetical protein [Gammaproteobacteria bacterium]
MMKLALFVFYITTAIFFSSVSASNEPDFKILNYDILSEGIDVGDATLKLLKTKDRLLIVEHSNIKISGFLWSIDLTTVLSEEFQHDSGFMKSYSKTVDDGMLYWTKISPATEMFLGKYIEIDKISTQEEKLFSRLVFLVTGKISSNVEEIISASEAIFTKRTKKVEEGKFPKGSFDVTINELPFFIQRNTGKQLPQNLNILDTENLEISQMSINDLGMKTIQVGNQKIQVRHLILSDKKQTSQLWIKEDVTSLPYIVRHTGEDEDGKYEITLKPGHKMEN